MTGSGVAQDLRSGVTIALPSARRVVELVALLPGRFTGLLMPLSTRLASLVARCRLRCRCIRRARQGSSNPGQQRHPRSPPPRSKRVARAPIVSLRVKRGSLRSSLSDGSTPVRSGPYRSRRGRAGGQTAGRRGRLRRRSSRPMATGRSDPFRTVAQAPTATTSSTKRSTRTTSTPSNSPRPAFGNTTSSRTRCSSSLPKMSLSAWDEWRRNRSPPHSGPRVASDILH